MSEPEKDPDNKANREKLLTSGAIALAAPAIGYATVFAHEWGFVSTFGVPVGFITLDLTTVFMVSVALIAVLSVAFWVGNILSVLWSEDYRPTVTQVQIFLILVIALAGVAVIASWPTQWKPGLYLLLWSAFMAFLDFIFPLITQRGKGTYRQKLEAQRVMDQKDKTLPERLISLVGPRSVLAVLALIVCVSLVALHGAYSAEHQKQYLVLETEDSGEAVVLRSYHDHLVCALFDRETKQVKRTYFVLNTASDSPRILTLEKVGPLRLESD